MNTKTNIIDLDLPELTKAISEWGEPEYRARQIWQGLYQNLYDSPEVFSTLPKKLRDKLSEMYSITSLQPVTSIQSKDGFTEKTLFAMKDGLAIETVLMQYETRHTLCISTQAGCAMGCVFCATGQMGFKRNLTSGEIVEQVLYYARILAKKGQRPTNVVIMGMGEPFHNYDATINAILRLNHPDGFNLGQRRFTISTVGLIPGIKRFAGDARVNQVNLAISLHASNDELRNSMLPVNQKYPIADLMKACREYVAKTNRRLTFEWALIKDKNDTPQEAQALGRLLAGINCHVNAIRLNPTEGYSGKASDRERADEFKAILESYKIPCTIRMRRGIDIQAGCGQLATKTQLPDEAPTA